jgi:hypothetical protein
MNGVLSPYSEYTTEPQICSRRTVWAAVGMHRSPTSARRLKRCMFSYRVNNAVMRRLKSYAGQNGTRPGI